VLNFVELHTHRFFKFALNSHQPLLIDNKYFASIASALLPCCRQIFATNKIPLQKVIKLSFNNAVNLHNQSRAHLEVVQQTIKKRVSARIQNILANKKSFRLGRLPTLNIDYEGINENTDCYLFAYFYWKKLVNDVPGAGIHRNHSSRYFDFGLGSYPLIPTPLEQVNFNSQLNSGATEGGNRLAPLDLVFLVYELDLWWCYKSILKYFDTLKTYRDTRSWNQFYAALPEWAWPGTNYNDNLVIVNSAANTFDLYLPSTVVTLSFDDLELSE